MPNIRRYKKADLVAAISPGRLAFLRLVASEASARGLALYIVGGFVRDLLLGRPATDFDLVVVGDAIPLARSLAGKYGGKVTSHVKFGTAVWSLDNHTLARLNYPVGELAEPQTVDIISARSETYKHPGALPTVRLGTLEDDLRRRDFTVNTLALRLDEAHFGQLCDDLGGLTDLEQGLVRVLHPLSYVDDPTRILRAVRYEQRYGFQITPDNIELIRQAAPLLEKISGERLRHELDLTLAEEKPAAVFSRLDGLDILRTIHPSLKWESFLERPFASLTEAEPASWHGVANLPRVPRRVALGYLLWLGRLAAAEIESLAARLDFTASLRQALLASSSLHSDPLLLSGNKKPSTITARLDEAPLLVVCALSLESVNPSAPLRDSVTESVDESVPLRESAKEFVNPSAPLRESATESVNKSVPLRESATESVNKSVPLRESVTKSVDESAPLRESATESVNKSAPLRESATESVNPSAPLRESATESVNKSVPLRESAKESVNPSVPLRESVTESVNQYLSHWRHIHPKTTGHTLVKFGLPPGPAYQTVLNRLRAAWLDGEIKTAGDEQSLLEKLINMI